MEKAPETGELSERFSGGAYARHLGKWVSSAKQETNIDHSTISESLKIPPIEEFYLYIICGR